MKRTRTSSSKLSLARETVRRLVDSHLVHVAGGDGVGAQGITDNCLTNYDRTSKRDPVP